MPIATTVELTCISRYYYIFTYFSTKNREYLLYCGVADLKGSLYAHMLSNSFFAQVLIPW